MAIDYSDMTARSIDRDLEKACKAVRAEAAFGYIHDGMGVPAPVHAHGEPTTASCIRSEAALIELWHVIVQEFKCKSISLSDVAYWDKVQYNLWMLIPGDNFGTPPPVMDPGKAYNLLDRAISWSKTPQGPHYWEDVYGRLYSAKYGPKAAVPVPAPAPAPKPPSNNFMMFERDHAGHGPRGDRTTMPQPRKPKPQRTWRALIRPSLPGYAGLDTPQVHEHYVLVHHDKCTAVGMTPNWHAKWTPGPHRGY